MIDKHYTIFFMNIKHMRHSASHIVGVLLSKVIAFNLSMGYKLKCWPTNLELTPIF